MNRIINILDLLASNKSIKVTLLAELLDVSQVTLRRDLDNLERKGIIRRSHGYASLDGADDTAKRLAINHSVKRRIAKAAALTVDEGETVMIESGSCCVLFAEELAFTKRNITIITNSAFLANYICKQPGIKIILLGGSFQPESHVLVGSITTKCAENFYSDKFFLGTDGFIPDYGFTGRDHQRADTAMGISKYAKKVFVLTESAKFKQRGAFSLIKFDKISGIFTDDKIPNDAETIIKNNNIKLYKVSSTEEQVKWRQFPGQPPFTYNEKIYN